MSATSELISVEVPDIGDFHDVPIIEIHVEPGQQVAAEDPLVTLESDKATMDVPAPAAGTVRELHVSIGDKVSQGSLLLTLEPAGAGGDGAAPASREAAGEHAPSADTAPASPPTAPATPAGAPSAPAAASPAPAAAAPAEAPPAPPAAQAGPSSLAPPGAPPNAGADGGGPIYASPAVRRLARELGVDLRGVRGSGRKGRITKEDVQAVAQRGPSAAGAPAATTPAAGVAGLSLAPWPVVDFERFGPVERVERSRIQRISGPALARNWVMIPHVTHNDEADITELEAWRKQLNEELREDGVKVTMVSFLICACVATLKRFPTFNASLDGEQLVLRRYYNIGFAADTPAGLVVPVIKGADRKGLVEIARELGELSAKARAGKLTPDEMQGGTFTISSLGGIGGTSFTPIINAPEVAILGVTRAATKPVWNGREFAPRLMLPLSLSYDHRVIDGAAAARFVVHLAGVLSDLRRVLL
jgi:pyruvate dehydrogenase E2 component (dihydrolipoamide acetyltransferase)